MYTFNRNAYLEAHKKLFAAYNEKYANRTTPLFEDGVICPDNYQGIVFLLKEAYNKDSTNLSPSLINDLKKHGPWGMWNHVAEWVYGLTRTTEISIPAFNPN